MNIKFTTTRAKGAAKNVRDLLNSMDIKINHTDALKIVAAVLGFEQTNIMLGSLDKPEQSDKTAKLLESINQYCPDKLSDGEFCHTLITVGVLSEDPIDQNMSLSDVAYEMYEGRFVGLYGVSQLNKLNKEDMAAALIKFGSEPDFFNIGTFDDEK